MAIQLACMPGEGGGEWAEMRTGAEQRDSGHQMQTGTLSETLKPLEIACFYKSSCFAQQQ